MPWRSRMAIILVAVLAATFVVSTWLVLLARFRATARRCERDIGEVLAAIGGLREQLAVAAALRAVPPQGAASVAAVAAREKAPAAIARRVVPVTRDDDPVHERPTVEVMTPPASRVREGGLSVSSSPSAPSGPTAAIAAPMHVGERESAEELTRVLSRRAQAASGEGSTKGVPGESACPEARREVFFEDLVDSHDETPHRSAGLHAAMRPSR